MNKTFTQTRTQSVFYRLYRCVIQLIWIIAPILLVAAFKEKNIATLDFMIYSTFGIAILFIVWLLIFNSGKSKVIEHGLEVNEKGILYINYGSKKFISWEHFSGIKMKGWFPRMVVLQSSRTNHIKFCYYVFSSSQRKEIFDCLRVR